MALGDFAVDLRKPLGLILQERDAVAADDDGGSGRGGVRVKELAEGGVAAARSEIAPGDVLLEVNGDDVSSLDFDSVMDRLISLDDDAPVALTVGDGLGSFDMPKNVLKMLKSSEDAYFVDAIVRRAVRTMRRDGKLGDVLRVEVIIGAGVQDEDDDDDVGTSRRRRRGKVRFFAIFSTDGGVTSYSCNVSATAVRQDGEDGSVKMLSLSAAKDEGLGQTHEFL